MAWPVGQYELLKPAFMPPAPGMRDEFLQPGDMVFHNGMPARHLLPVDSAAQSNVAYLFGAFATIAPQCDIYPGVPWSMHVWPSDEELAVLYAFAAIDPPS